LNLELAHPDVPAISKVAVNSCDLPCTNDELLQRDQALSALSKVVDSLKSQLDDHAKKSEALLSHCKKQSSVLKVYRSDVAALRQVLAPYEEPLRFILPTLSDNVQQLIGFKPSHFYSAYSSSS